MNDQEQQFAIEAERSIVTIEQAIKYMDEFGGDIRIFAFTMLRASAHFFAEVHSQKDLERAMTNIVKAEQSRREPCGRA